MKFKSLHRWPLMLTKSHEIFVQSMIDADSRRIKQLELQASKDMAKIENLTNENKDLAARLDVADNNDFRAGNGQFAKQPPKE